MTIRPARRRPARFLLAIAGTLALLLVGCFQQNEAPRDPPITIVEAEATSNTSLLVRFSAPLGPGADVVTNYLVTDPDETVLRILAAYPLGDGTTVALATEPQADVPYSVTVRNLTLASGDPVDLEVKAPQVVAGSAVAAPFLADAVPLSNTEVLVTFGLEGGALAKMNDDALIAAAYRFEPALEVEGVTFSTDGAARGRVVLSTASMADERYTLRVGAVTSGPRPMLLDPMRSERTFQGIAGIDERPPELLGAYATDATTVVVRFSEPLDEEAADASRWTVTGPSGAVAIARAEPELEGTRVVLTTSALEATASYTLTPGELRDLAGNPLGNGASAAFDGVASGTDGTPPHVTGAVSTSATRVVVAFSEPVRGGSGSAENPDHYSIVSSATLSTQAVVEVSDARLAADGRSVALTTRPQSEIEYTLRVANVVDLDGVPVAGPDRSRPFEIEFFGTGESGPGDDSDGDGLSDAAEGLGWTVRITEADGTVSSREVTSDPEVVDTDGDGVSDADERTYRTNPRSADSDGDALSDDRELNHIYSEPAQADSDGDGLPDGLEFDFFGTSPIRADTDGDGYTDADENVADSRHPLIADLPRIAIRVGDVRLSLDERFDYTDREGKSQSIESSTSTTIEQGSERTFATSDTNTLSSSQTFSQEVGAEFEFPKFGGKATVTLGAEQSQAEEYTSSVSRASATSANQAYNESLARASTIEASSEVTRTIDDASVRIALDLGSVSDVAFSATNLEVTAMWQDPVDRERYIPIATLVPSSQLTGGGTPTYNLGPFVPDVGPIVFENRDIFPQTVEELLKAPHGLVFKVANYDMQDEDGRNFAFASQESYDVTAGIVIDDGTGTVRRERVSTVSGRIAPFADTNGDGRIDRRCSDDPSADSCDNDGDGLVDDADRILFDAEGRSVGLAMTEAMDLLGVDYIVQDVAYDDDEGGAGVEILYGVDGLETVAADHAAWVLYYSPNAGRGLEDGEEVETTPFENLILRAGETYTISYVRDRDEDGLKAREEYAHGSDDERENSDGKEDLTCPDEGHPLDLFVIDAGATLPLDPPQYTCDTIGDYEEIKIGWQVDVRGQTEYKSYASPRLPDSDADGLADHMERDLGTDAHKRDTDEDGLSDFDEVYGFQIRFRGDLAFSDLTAKFCADLRTGGSCTGATESWVTDPLDFDTDGDGMRDGFEASQGSHPQVADAGSFIDTDSDGLSDADERSIGSSIYEADSDTDGLPDLLEFRIGSDPQSSDSDGDGLSDLHEFDLYDHATLPSVDGFDADAFLRVCGSVTYNATACSYAPPSGAGLPYGTDPANEDTDGDLLSDRVELLEPYTVRVQGEEAYASTSDPTRPHTDEDGLDDRAERDLGTDPTIPDTDGDGADDPHESEICTLLLDCLDPLVPDQLVTVAFTLDVVRDGDVDVEGGPGEWYYSFRITDAPFDLASSGDESISDDQNVTVWQITFVRRIADVLRITGNVYESDIDTTCHGSVDQSFDTAVTAASSFDTGELTDYVGSIVAECKYTLYVDITVQTEPEE